MLLLEVTNAGLILRMPDGSSRTVLQDISFAMIPGESVAIIGPSGSGKTMLARCIAGLRKPTSGSIHLNASSEARARNASPVQMLFQNHTASLNPLMTVRESITEGFEAAGDEAGAVRMEEILQRVALSADLLDRLPATLSGGERQRVALARALAARPALLIADEPTSALDRMTAEHLLSILHDAAAAQGVGLMHITHNQEYARRTGDRALILEAGKLIADGTWSELEATSASFLH